MQRVTDRRIDTNADGVKESVSLSVGTQIGTSNKFNPPSEATVPVGAARTILETVAETDGGVDLSGTEFTEGT
jgi:hypothetical protein